MQNLSTPHLSSLISSLLLNSLLKSALNRAKGGGSRAILISIFIFLALALNSALAQASLSGPKSESPLQKTSPIEEKKRVDINTAPLEDLVKIVHIGETRAKELISLRPFYSLDELTKIKGVGEKKLKDIKKQGLAWVDPNLKPPESEKTKKELAVVAQPLKEEYLGREIPKSLSLFLTAFSLAIFSGIIILILKNTLKKNL